mmetsp:Transcript_85730/g.247507  ORF Transcript_85730/g.247507 Transcript_85730/m.247507 type:complete len:294 (+) Transcript_85730:255-1136(+)
MTSDLSRTSGGAEPMWQLLEQGLDEDPGRSWEMERHHQALSLLAPPQRQQPLHRLADALVFEGRLACEELEGDDTKRPPIHVHVMAVGEVDHLRGHVLGSARQRIGLPEHKPCEAHVAQLRVAPLVEQHVLGLQIPVHDSPLVQVLDRGGEARDVERGGRPPRTVLAEHIRVLTDDINQAASESGLKQEVEALLVIVKVVQPDDERAPDHAEQFPLPSHQSFCALGVDVALGQRLQSIALLRDHTLYQFHLSISAFAQKADASQGVQLHLPPFCRPQAVAQGADLAVPAYTLP